MRVVTIVCWLVAAAVLTGLAIWFLTGTVFGFGSGGWTGLRGISNLSFNIGGWENLSGPFEVAGEYTASASGVSSIKIDWIASTVDVEPYDGNDIKITEFAQRKLSDAERLYVSMSGDTLTIRFRERSFSGNMPQKKLEVLIPRQLCGNLNMFEVDSTSGGINVEGVSAVAFKTDAISGAVNITNVKAGSFHVSTTSGSLTVKSVQAEDMKLEGITGSVHVSGSSAGKINCDTTSGRINIEGAYNSVKLNSISGNMTLDDTAQGADVIAETTSGTIELTGSFNEVKTNNISGSATVKSSIIPSSLKADSTSGRVSVYVPNEGTISVNHSSTSGRFSSDVPVTMQNKGAQFSFSTISGTTKIYVLD